MNHALYKFSITHHLLLGQSLPGLVGWWPGAPDCCRSNQIPVWVHVCVWVCVCVSVGFYAFILVRMYKMQGCVLRGWFSTCVSAFRVSVWYACAMRIFMHLHGHIHVHALQHFAFQVVTGLPARHGLRFVNCRRMPLRTCAARRSLMYNCGRLASTSEAMRYGAPRSRWLLRCGASCGLA